MAYMKPGSPFLYDDQTGDVVGIKDADGSERPLFSIVISLSAWAYAQTFQLVSATRDANGAITTASIVWPDGTAGAFTTDVASTAFPGAIDAWHATYAGTPTRTVTQPTVTRDANGAVTVQPAITIS